MDVIRIMRVWYIYGESSIGPCLHVLVYISCHSIAAVYLNARPFEQSGGLLVPHSTVYVMIERQPIPQDDVLLVDTTRLDVYLLPDEPQSRGVLGRDIARTEIVGVDVDNHRTRAIRRPLGVRVGIMAVKTVNVDVASLCQCGVGICKTDRDLCHFRIRGPGILHMITQ